MAVQNPSRTIFIGNIPYGLSEEQIISIFSSAGQVLNFRLVTDQESGRPKGYGFAEFADADAAASAVRNLNDHQIMGRQLRVDFSHKDNSGGNAQKDGNTGGQFSAGGTGGAPPVNVSAVPPGVPLPPGVSCPDAISQTLATIAPAQLLDILSQFKSVVTQNPDSATELLRQQPQLAYAIFQCLLTMGLVESKVLQQVIEQVATGKTGALGEAPPATATPPVQPPYQPPPTQQQPPQMAAPPQLPPGQMDAIKAILNMPQQQYMALSDVERSQVDAVRMQYGSMVR